MTNFRVTNNNQNASSIKKYFKYSTIALSSVAVGYLYGINTFEKHSYKTNFSKLQVIEELKSCCKELTLKTKQDLAFKALDINPSNSDKYIIFCNGMFTTMDSKNQKIYAELLKTKRGVIAFDYPGRGESTANFSQKNAQQSLESVHNYLLQKGIKQENIGIVAHSMGCAVAGKFAATHKLNFLVLLSPYNKAKDLVKNFVERSKLPQIIKIVVKNMPTCLIPLKYTFNNEKYLKKANCSIMIIASKDDKTVPINLTQKLKEKIKNKNLTYKEFLIGGHEINKEKIDESIKYIQNILSEKNSW